ncbi:hypothetical protein [Paenibacillus sp. XY044]|uniref:hypothetical protein n=1 Tax=Paenibacillus sp. XY044 TaxID=2026089 RepID=UPI000B993848|nr:hypothetical protein [Paenibacillus sp. XY044]OZB98112.1 hypothetical protein CJP46_02790 [Paenibacillus sp. XY044]
MARLSAERLRLHINNIITWTVNENPMYENFTIKLTILGRETVPGLNGSHELVDGNIEYLMDTIKKSLEGFEYTECEFLEPDFKFEIKRHEAWYDNGFKIHHPVSFEFIVWVNSGRWNGIYSCTELGHKFCIEENSLIKFYDDLKSEWENRKILEY